MLSFKATTVLDTASQHKLAEASGFHNLKRGTGEVYLKTPTLVFSKQNLSPKIISPRLSVLQETTGQMSLSSQLQWDASNLKSKGSINLSDLSVATDTIAVKKINTDLSLSNLWPLATRKPQQIKISNISSGLDLKNPEITFSLKGTSVLIHKFIAQFIGGNIQIDNVTLNPEKKQHALTLNLSHLNLERLFNLIELEGVTGTGQMTGKLPLILSKDDIIITDGILVSDKPGVLQFRSEKAKQALGGAGEQVDLLLRVLSNFHYKKLSLKINRQKSHNAVVNLHIEGNNPTVMDARPFNLNINLEGNIDRLLETVLEGYRLSDRAIRDTVSNAQ